MHSMKTTGINLNTQKYYLLKSSQEKLKSLKKYEKQCHALKTTKKYVH